MTVERRRGPRYRVPGTPSRRRVEIALTDDELALIQRAACSGSQTTADLIRMATLDWLAAGDDIPTGALVLRNRTRKTPYRRATGVRHRASLRRPKEKDKGGRAGLSHTGSSVNLRR